MEPNVAQFINKGMQQDYSISKASNEFAYKNHNIRITTRGENSLLTVTNEKSNRKLPVYKYGDSVYSRWNQNTKSYHNLSFGQERVLSKVELDCKGTYVDSYETIEFESTIVVWLDGDLYAEFNFEDYIENYVENNIRIKDISKIRIWADLDGSYEEVSEPQKLAGTGLLFRIIEPLKGTVLGYALTKEKIILFTKSLDLDYIYSYDVATATANTGAPLTTLYSGKLGFDLNCPIETLYNYESESVEKIYWVDGKNQPRVININDDIQENNDTQFDFNPAVNTDLIVDIEKVIDGSGVFKPGTIQYVITYYNNNAQETAPVYVSPLYYLSNANKGNSPEDDVSCSFTITCSNIDGNWDNIVLYSIHRNSLNSTAVGYKVKELNIKNYKDASKIVFIDTGTNNESIDATTFLFNNDDFTPSTLASKGNKLFFGDIKSTEKEDLTFMLKNRYDVTVEFDRREIEYPNYGGLYDYKTQLDKGENYFKTFKGGETYRIALQLQDNKGIWSSPIYLKDVINDKYPDVQGSVVKLPYVKANIPLEVLKEKIPNFDNYKRARLLMAEPTPADRSVFAQGILSPTVYNMNEVANGLCHNINSWMQRFTVSDKHLTNVNRNIKDKNTLRQATAIEVPIEKGYWLKDDIASSYEELSDSSDDTVAKKANIVSFTVVLVMSGDFNSSGTKNNSTFVLYLDKVKVNIYNDFGALIEEKSFDLANNVLSEGLVAGGNIIHLYKGKRFKKDLKELYSEIQLFLTSVTFNDKVIIWDNTALKYTDISLYNLIKNNIGSDITILNIKSNDKVFDDDKVIKWSFDEVYQQFYDAYDNKEDLDIQTQTITESYSQTTPATIQKAQLDSKNFYFTDANTVSFYSPELDNISTEDVKFRIVGCAKLRHNISDYDVSLDSPNGTKMNLNLNKGSYNYLRSHFLYHVSDFYKTKPSEGGSSATGAVLMSLWQKNGALSNNPDENILKRKIVGNLWYCDSAYYASNPEKTQILWEKDDRVIFKKALNPILTVGSKIYKKDYENLLIPIKGFAHMFREGATPFDDLKTLEADTESKLKLITDTTYNGCLIKYSSEDHGVIKLPKDIILPGYTPTVVEVPGPVRISTGESLTPQRDERYLPFALHKGIPDVSGTFGESEEGIPTISISIEGGDGGNTFRIPSGCYCPVVFYTYPELDDYLTVNVPEESFPGLADAVRTQLYDNNLVYGVSSTKGNVIKTFLKSLVNKPTSSGKAARRIGIYKNTGSTISSLGTHSATFELVGKMMTSSEFISTLSSVSVYPITSKFIDLKTDLEILSNAHANNCRAAIINNWPVLKYTTITQIVKGESDVFKYNIPNAYKDWNTHACIWIGELYRDVPNAYGGKDDLAISNTKYIICGDSFDIDNENSTLTINGNIGDTYFQRWDCLRTYPTTEEDTNSIVDVVSTMLESHTNLDGRYDNTRGRTDIINIRPSNINLINKAYSQPNNFFSYYSVDKRLSNVTLSNCYTWSLTKTNNELIDNWTKGLMVNVNNVDGAKGKITKLQLWKDYLLVFQEKGIARIHYNDQTTIGSIEGVPIEIQNSQFVSGHNYLSEAVGCHNKWSIVPTESGIYFVDSINKSINIFNGGVVNLSYNKSFKDWGTLNLNDVVWSPTNKQGYYGSFDFKNRDYYLTNADNCLCFSEELQAFSSFYDYTESPIMFSFKDRFIGLQSKDQHVYLWDQFRGQDYCNFYGEQKDYYMEFNINPNPIKDKIFTNLEYRAYVDDSDDTFDNLEVSNEYQYGICNPNISKHKYPNAERKFRIWRLDVPRDIYSRKQLDRIRNPWVKVKLTKKDNTNNRMNFHDLLIKYFE